MLSLGLMMVLATGVLVFAFVSARNRRKGAVLGTRVLTTLVPAALGAVGGYVYARFLVPPDAFHLMPMYSAAGAAVAILTLRVAVIFKAILSDYFGSSAKE